MKFWDTVASRYPCPFDILDCWLASGQLSRFIREAWGLYQESLMWDLWLHKVNDRRSFNEFKADLKKGVNGPTPKGRKLTEEEIIRTLNESKKIFEEINRK